MSHKNSTRRIYYRTSGFTLLELLLVVFIMSILAYSAMSLTESLDSTQDQFRYERAKRQAEQLKQAIVHRVDGQKLVSGFVADMGDMPANMTELVFGVMDGDPTDQRFMASAPITLEYDSTPDVNTGANNGLGNGLPISTLRLVKGFRGTPLDTDETNSRPFFYGAYATPLPGKQIYDGPDKPRFDDGWGNSGGMFHSISNEPSSNVYSEDDKTHGWNWSYDGNLIIGSFGKDGKDNHPELTGYEGDVLLTTISQEDWSVTPSSLQAELYNDLGDLDLTSQYEFSILIFNARIAVWRTIVSEPFSLPAEGQVRTVSFNYPNSFPRIPVGNHALLMHQANGAVDTSIYQVSELTKGDSDHPERQEIIESSNTSFRLSVTVPDPQDPSTTVTEQNVNGFSDLLVALNDLNAQLVSNTQYISGPLIWVGVNSSTSIVEIDLESSSTLSNQDVDPIMITYDSGTTYRVIPVYILPRQNNIFRMNLSTLTQ